MRALISWLLVATGLGAAPRLHAQDQRFVYVSNVTGTTRDSAALTTIEAQTTRALERVDDSLRAHGLGLGDVVVANVFLTDARHFAGMNEVYRTFFPVDPPTRATAEVDLTDPDAMIQLSVVAARGPRQVIDPPELASPSLPYSWGIRVGNTLFLAGATSRNPATYAPEPGDVGAQTRRIFGNLGLVLRRAGMDYGDLASCRVFLEDPRRFGEMNRAYAEFVPADAPPARATLGAGLMHPLFDVEIQCTAERSATRRVVIAEGGSRPRSPYSPAIATEERLYLAGMLGGGPDVTAQTRATLENLRATLAAARLDFTHVTDTWVYVADIRQWDAVRTVLDEVLPAGTPRGTVIGAPLMGATLLVEIQMVARR